MDYTWLQPYHMLIYCNFISNRTKIGKVSYEGGVWVGLGEQKRYGVTNGQTETHSLMQNCVLATKNRFTCGSNMLDLKILTNGP